MPSVPCTDALKRGGGVNWHSRCGDQYGVIGNTHTLYNPKMLAIVHQEMCTQYCCSVVGKGGVAMDTT